MIGFGIARRIDGEDRSYLVAYKVVQRLDCLKAVELSAGKHARQLQLGEWACNDEVGRKRERGAACRCDVQSMVCARGRAGA